MFKARQMPPPPKDHGIDLKEFDVLIACEYSGRLRDAMIKVGANAISCDLLPTESTGPHYCGNVLDILYAKTWKLLIAHPDCTYLCSSGLHWNKRTPGRQEKTDAALEFVRKLMNAPCEKMALENPVGCISTQIRKPDQMIQPYDYGEDASKRTCLWLKNLPLLKPTGYHPPRFVCGCGHEFEYNLGKHGCPNCNGDNGPAKQRWGNQTNSGQNKLGPSATRGKDRALTYQGWADAMADQWGRLL